jgi:23S rRNA (uracil1939-C5)-methyltransferase
MTDNLLRIGDIIEVQTERLAFGGEAVARYQGLAIFIPLASPEERLRVRITERKKNFARAEITEIITPSKARVEPRCQYFGECGGCQLQHIRYENQLEAKVEFIRGALKRIGQIDWTDEIKIHSSEMYNYRLRAKIQIEFDKTCAEKPNQYGGNSPPNKNLSSIRIGFNRAYSHRVCDVEHCEILLPELNEALQTIRAAFRNSKKKIVQGKSEIELAVNDLSIISHPQRSIEKSVSTSPAICEFESKKIHKKVGGLSYQFTPAIFFQVNAFLLDEFVQEVVEAESGELAIDLYAGVGLFTLALAKKFQTVKGIESNAAAVKYALKNIASNQVSNAEIFCARTDKWLQEFIAQNPSLRPDLILLDPPRSGAVEAIEWIARLQPARIKYVSCDPNTLARDLKKLVAEGYKLERVVGFDMFPQTYHIETIAHLKKQ